jgi:hypothetical protein
MQVLQSVLGKKDDKKSEGTAAVCNSPVAWAGWDKISAAIKEHLFFTFFSSLSLLQRVIFIYCCLQ